MRKLYFIISAVILPLFILLASIQINAFNKNRYLDSFIKHDTTVITGKSIEELEHIVEEVLNYLKKGLNRKVLEPYFNQKEIMHMEDVKQLFTYGFIIQKISFTIILIALAIVFKLKDWKNLGPEMFRGIFVSLALFLLLFILSIKDFDRYFTYFHLVFFDNDLWILDPNKDLLIQMLPGEFFISIFISIILLFLGILAIIQIIIFMMIKKGRNGNGGIIKC